MDKSFEMKQILNQLLNKSKEEFSLYNPGIEGVVDLFKDFIRDNTVVTKNNYGHIYNALFDLIEFLNQHQCLSEIASYVIKTFKKAGYKIQYSVELKEYLDQKYELFFCLAVIYIYAKHLDKKYVYKKDEVIEITINLMNEFIVAL